MNIWMLTDDYMPSSRKVSAKMMHELACEAVAKGHDVTCITPNSYSDADHEVLDGVCVYRFKTGQVKNTGKVKRLINELRFSRKVIRLVTKAKLSPPDVIIYYSPSIFFGKAVKVLSARYGVPSYLILRDFFPQWTIDQGMIKSSSLVAKFLRYYERINYQAATKIGVMSPANLDWFNGYTDEKYYHKTEVLYNWVSPNALEHIDPNHTFRSQYGLEDKVIFIYGGNIGHAQDMTNVLELATRLRDHPRAHIVLIGQGDEYEFVKEHISQHSLKNILLLPSMAQNEYYAVQKVCDIGLFCLHKDHKTHNFPGKILGYLSQSLPILGCVNQGNDLLALVNSSGAGRICMSGEHDQMYRNALDLLELGIYQKTKENTKMLLEKHFLVSSCLDQLLAMHKSGNH